jgi:hypothetical protein
MCARSLAAFHGTRPGLAAAVDCHYCPCARSRGKLGGNLQIEKPQEYASDANWLWRARALGFRIASSPLDPLCVALSLPPTPQRPSPGTQPRPIHTRCIPSGQIAYYGVQPTPALAAAHCLHHAWHLPGLEYTTLSCTTTPRTTGSYANCYRRCRWTTSCHGPKPTLRTYASIGSSNRPTSLADLCAGPGYPAKPNT